NNRWARWIADIDNLEPSGACSDDGERSGDGYAFRNAVRNPDRADDSRRRRIAGIHDLKPLATVGHEHETTGDVDVPRDVWRRNGSKKRRRDWICDVEDLESGRAGREVEAIADHFDAIAVAECVPGAVVRQQNRPDDRGLEPVPDVHDLYARRAGRYIRDVA